MSTATIFLTCQCLDWVPQYFPMQIQLNSTETFLFLFATIIPLAWAKENKNWGTAKWSVLLHGPWSYLLLLFFLLPGSYSESSISHPVKCTSLKTASAMSSLPDTISLLDFSMNFYIICEVMEIKPRWIGRWVQNLLENPWKESALKMVQNSAKWKSILRGTD